MENSSKTKKMTGLGRGLGALLQDSEKISAPRTNARLSPTDVIGSMNEIDVSQIEANPYQPRTKFDQESLQELADSIRVQGIIQPITVRQLTDDSYQLISGERRLQASRLVGMTSIPAYIRTANDQQMLEMALIENIQRENLNSIEIALSYQRLILECNLKQEELGVRVGKNRTTVNNYIRLLKLPPVIQAALRDNKISMGHARAIITINSDQSQLKIFNKIIEEGWSVRKVEDEVRKLGMMSSISFAAKKQATINQEIKSLQFQLSSFFGAKVSVKSNNDHKGEIKIPFTSQDELKKILETLKFK
ncbi:MULTISPECIES: ParB/RepB/Spo0J family partition protein [Dyadobacter]|uniref:ParB/RepB/Spo0J family partition protein n=2 Tax=Dyadobacter TaxID=120831 RepID=A0A5R9KFI6_9BACT|nr:MULTISPECIES: ParB/RepB/Spo0J family partition protein [Dyadobacter]KAA6431501.1 ParB/RepB/Spo0J family partition protein [Dyadobacter flavalbus]TLU94920.1 ParB/RepB/Spo0J family partition protein [Dyadobacter sediminis]GGB86847.1 chromosome partitioning protein ParB [Dyadobacter sediminis]